MGLNKVRPTMCLGTMLLFTAPFGQAQSWVHPGVNSSQTDLTRVKQMVAGGVTPWRESWNRFTADPHSNVNWTADNWGVGGDPGPVATITANDTASHYTYIEQDASAAYQNALEWYVTGNIAYANQSIKIINTWATTLTSYSVPVDISAYIVALKFSAAAEILRYEPGSGWTSTNTANLTSMFVTQLRPSLYDCIVGGYNGGNPGDGNQGAGCTRGIMAMAIFNQNRSDYNWALSLFKGGTVSPTNPCVAETETTVNGVHQGYIDASGSPGEMGRDQAHPQDGMASYAEMAKMSQIQGTDNLWAWGNNRLLTAMEYMTEYNLGNSVSDFNDGTCYNSYGSISTTDRGQFVNMYEMAYQYYVVGQGLSMPYTTQELALTRSEPFSSDDTGWGTLLYTLNAGTAPVYDGAYEISNVQSGLALDTVSGDTGQGTQIEQDAYQSHSSQEWITMPVGNEYYQLYPKNGTFADIVDSGESPSTAGVDIHLWGNGPNDNQIWWMHSTSDGIQVVARDTRATALLTNLAWDITGGSDNSGTLIKMSDVANETEMKFNFTLAYPKTQASNYGSQSGSLSTQAASEGGDDLDNITNGTWSAYNSEFVEGTSAMDVRVATPNAGGTIQVHEGSPTGTLLGTGTVNYTGGWQQYGTITIPFTTLPSGTQNLYLTYAGGSGFLFNVLWFVCY